MLSEVTTTPASDIAATPADLAPARAAARDTVGSMRAGDRVCLLHTGRAVPEMLLGAGQSRAGGAELQLAEIARGLADRGWPITFAFENHGEADLPEQVDGIRLVSERRSGLAIPGLRFFTTTMPTCRRLIEKADADIYLQRGAGWQNGVIARYCQRHGRRFILWLASATDPYCDDPARSRLPLRERWLARNGMRNADLIVAQTNEQQSAMLERHGREAVLIRNIWAAPTPEPEPPVQPPEVFWAATMRGLKRPHLVLDVAEQLPDLNFVLAGGPADDDAELYSSVTERAEGMPNVTVLGFVPFREIDGYFKRASAYLCTSTVEGFPNTFLQSWSHGRPVVSTVDPDGVIAEYDLGVHCRETSQLAAAVRHVCDENETYTRRTWNHVRSFHAPGVIMPQIEAMLQSQ
jgi:ribosomal protein S18 acetylase RimI-like enzyme